jgi:hypothetical protein
LIGSKAFDSIGEIRRTHPSKVGVGLVHGGIRKIVMGTVDTAELERHGLPSLAEL